MCDKGKCRVVEGRRLYDEEDVKWNTVLKEKTSTGQKGTGKVWRKTGSGRGGVSCVHLCLSLKVYSFTIIITTGGGCFVL